MATLSASGVHCRSMCNAKMVAGAEAPTSTSKTVSASLGAFDKKSPLRYSVKRAVNRTATSRVLTVCKVSVGDVPPNFTLEDQNGRNVSLSKFKGKNVVVYFYPADDTPGCTKEACSFRDSYADFKKLGAEVIGISADSPESHQAFKEKYDLPFTLLTDEGNEVRQAWGVPKDFLGLLQGRQTYVINKKGVVELIFNNQFQAEKHVEESLAALESQTSKVGGFWPF